MRRRSFLTLLILTPTIASSLFQNRSWAIIKDVQNILFPKSKNFPSADEFKAYRYLKIQFHDNMIDKDDIKFLLKGAKYLESFGYKLSLSNSKKNTILNQFAKDNIGKGWIELLLEYTIEALFSDPIYGGNANKIGWIKYNHKPGYPRPKVKYAKHSL